MDVVMNLISGIKSPRIRSRQRIFNMLWRWIMLGSRKSNLRKSWMGFQHGVHLVFEAMLSPGVRPNTTLQANISGCDIPIGLLDIIGTEWKCPCRTNRNFVSGSVNQILWVKGIGNERKVYQTRYSKRIIHHFHSRVTMMIKLGSGTVGKNEDAISSTIGRTRDRVRWLAQFDQEQCNANALYQLSVL
jgi:hypothetical protein